MASSTSSTSSEWPNSSGDEEVAMTMDMERVLLVEADATSRGVYGRWLEDCGYDVMTCPGPTAPDYTCVGAREGYCPLVGVADIVVLDLDLDSEIEETGTSASELLGLYTNSGKASGGRWQRS